MIILWKIQNQLLIKYKQNQKPIILHLIILILFARWCCFAETKEYICFNQVFFNEIIQKKILVKNFYCTLSAMPAYNELSQVDVKEERIPGHYLLGSR